MAQDRPSVVILAGPNGAGKTTVAGELLRATLGVDHYVNADTIARGLSAYDSASVSLEAGRILLQRLGELADAGLSFAFETTLASRSYARHVARWLDLGYVVHLLFLYLPSVETAVARVAARVRRGGHDIPEADIRRRYRRGLRNLFTVYMPLVSLWSVYDNQIVGGPALMAMGDKEHRGPIWMADRQKWLSLERTWRDEP